MWVFKEEPVARRDLVPIFKYLKGSAEKTFCSSGHLGSNSQNWNQLKFHGKRLHLRKSVEVEGRGQKG